MLGSGALWILKEIIKIVHDEGLEMKVSTGEAFSCALRNDARVVEDEEIIFYEFNNSVEDSAVRKSGE
jgi:hypothetical protein